MPECQIKWCFWTPRGCSWCREIKKSVTQKKKKNQQCHAFICIHTYKWMCVCECEHVDRLVLFNVLSVCYFTFHNILTDPFWVLPFGVALRTRFTYWFDMVVDQMLLFVQPSCVSGLKTGVTMHCFFHSRG